MREFLIFNQKISIIFQIIIIFNFFTYEKSSVETIDKIEGNFGHSTKELNKKLKKNEIQYPKRKLFSDDEYTDLKIFIDLYNFNWTYPNDTLGRDYKDIIIESIYFAKDIITDLAKMVVMATQIEFQKNSLEDWVKYWDAETLEAETFVNPEVYNFFIFFKFSKTIKNDASSVIVLSFDNPEAGVITINENMDKSKLTKDYLTTLMIHEFIHLLGFHVENDEFDTSIIVPREEEEGKLHYYLTEENNPNFIEYVQKYFKNDEINEIELELNEDGNIHFPSRYFLGDIMTEFIYPEEQIISGFIVAFFEDYDYVKIKKKYTGGLMQFGKAKGKNFFKSCSEKTDEITFANEFYLPIIASDISYAQYLEPSCSSSRMSKTVHKVHYYENPPNTYEYLQYQSGGLENTNYCPISEYQDKNQEYIYAGRCSEKLSSIDNLIEEKIGESFSNTSFCVLSSLISNKLENYELYFKLRSVCYEMICSSLSLTIKVGENYIVCPRTGGKIKAENYEGYLLCPDYNLICSGTKLCNNIFNCIDQKSEEKEGAFTYDYTIKTTQNSSFYLSDQETYGFELTEEGLCPYFCSQCELDSTCIKCAPHYKIYNKEDNKCLPIVPNCHDYDDNDVCINCNDSYSLALEDNDTFICLDTNTLKNDKHYFKVGETNSYKRCRFGISNCKECNSDTDCTSCNDGYNLVKGADDKITCQNIDINYYYEETEESKKYYIKCDKDIPNCNKCSSSNYCTECQNNYGIIEDDHTNCENLLTEKYYKETSTGKYRLCSNKVTNCEKCTLDESNFSCKQCITNYAVKHENDIQCVEKSNLKDNRLFYTNDSEINYYSCEKYSVENCKECNNKDTCLTCQTNHVLTNESTLCVPQSIIDDKLGIYDRELGIYTPCNAVLSYCNKCDNSTTCFECGNGAGLEESNICISKEFIENHTYVLDEETHKYVNCSIINNCITCTSTTICTLCKDEFKINNNICVEAKSLDDDSDDKLSTGAIIGIVFGCIGFLAIVVVVAFFLLKKLKKPLEAKVDSSIVIHENKVDNLENQNQDENAEKTEEATTKKRRIQNN